MLLALNSYTKLSSVVDHMFPPIEDKKESENFGDFNSFNYWRDILPEISNELEKEKKREEEDKLKKLTSTSPKSAAKK